MGYGVCSELRYLFPEILAALVIVEGGRQEGLMHVKAHEEQVFVSDLCGVRHPLDGYLPQKPPVAGH